MSTLLQTHGAIITLDFLPIGQSHNPHVWLLNYQGQSTDYALTHGGYAIEEREDQIRGYMAYLLAKSREGYGINGWIVRSIEAFQAISLDEGGKFTNDYHFEQEIAAPQLQAIRASLNYTEGNLDNIRGALDSWICLVAERFGINPDNI